MCNDCYMIIPQFYSAPGGNQFLQALQLKKQYLSIIPKLLHVRGSLSKANIHKKIWNKKLSHLFSLFQKLTFQCQSPQFIADEMHHSLDPIVTGTITNQSRYMF